MTYLLFLLYGKEYIIIDSLVLGQLEILTGTVFASYASV